MGAGRLHLHGGGAKDAGEIRKTKAENTPTSFAQNSCFIFSNKTGFGSFHFTEVCPKVCLVPVPFWVGAGEAIFTSTCNEIVLLFWPDSIFRAVLLECCVFNLWPLILLVQNVQHIGFLVFLPHPIDTLPAESAKQHLAWQNEALWCCIRWVSNKFYCLSF